MRLISRFPFGILRPQAVNSLCTSQNIHSETHPEIVILIGDLYHSVNFSGDGVIMICVSVADKNPLEFSHVLETDFLQKTRPPDKTNIKMWRKWHTQMFGLNVGGSLIRSCQVQILFRRHNNSIEQKHLPHINPRFI